MIDPTCPADYNCTFTLLHPRVVEHQLGPWWHGPGGLAVAILAVIGIVIIAITIAIKVSDLFESRNKRRQQYIETQEQRKHDLAMEEQRTMQAEQAKGDPEMLRLIRQRI